MLILYDHTEKGWLRKKTRENGAATYSKDIVSHQLHNIKSFSREKKVIVSTCQRFSKIPKIKRIGNVSIFIQYLHTYPYLNPLNYIEVISRACKRNVLFITAYNSFNVLMNKRGYKSKFIPMMINTQELSRYNNKEKFKDRIIYFGNRYSNKTNLYHEIEYACNSLGIALDSISDGIYSRSDGRKTVVSQKDAWGIIGKYQYGIGVGRCALEMYAIGLQVLIAGAEFGGLVMDEHDWIVQEKTNFNGRCITFDRDIKVCLQCLSESMLNPVLLKDIKSENHISFIK